MKNVTAKEEVKQVPKVVPGVFILFLSEQADYRTSKYCVFSYLRLLKISRQLRSKQARSKMASQAVATGKRR